MDEILNGNPAARPEPENTVTTWRDVARAYPATEWEIVTFLHEPTSFVETRVVFVSLRRRAGARQ